LKAGRLWWTSIYIRFFIFAHKKNKLHKLWKWALGGPRDIPEGQVAGESSNFIRTDMAALIYSGMLHEKG